jgi:hypothetical protein
MDTDSARWEVQALSHNGTLWEVLGIVIDDEKKFRLHQPRRSHRRQCLSR